MEGETQALVLDYAVNIVGAIIVLVLGWWASKTISSLVGRALSRSGKVDSMLQDFFVSVTKYAILVLVGIFVLGLFGIQTTSLVAIVGAAGLAIGLALQGTLSNVAAGVMILLFRPFKAGDFIEAGGQTGTVVSVTLFVSELKTPDNIQILVPNSQMWGSAVKNYSHHATRRVDLVLGIAYEDDIDAAMTIVRDVVGRDERIHKEPEPFLVVGELADNSVNLILRVWVANGDYWGVKFDLTGEIKKAFDSGGISIPYPQRTVHMVQAAE